MYCSYCGNANIETAKFCIKCGKDISFGQQQSVIPPPISSPAPPEFHSKESIKPGRGGLLLAMGLLSLLSGPLLGIPTWIMGRKDLKKIQEGTNDPASKSLTKVGFVLGIIGTLIIPVTFLIVSLIGSKEVSVTNNRDAVSNDVINLAARAQQFYRRPISNGGGGGSFVRLTADAAGIAKLTNNSRNSNGTYSIVKTSADEVTILGIGASKAENGNYVSVQCVVSPHDFNVLIIN